MTSSAAANRQVIVVSRSTCSFMVRLSSYSALAILRATILLCLGYPSYVVPIFIPGVRFCRGC